MNEAFVGSRIRQHLNRGLHDLPPETRQRLASARQQALLCQKQSMPTSVLAVAGRFVQFQFSHRPVQQAFLTLALLSCLTFSAFWLADAQVAELGALDSALLTNDLPIGAFTDKGFDAWLKRASQE